MEQEVMNLPSKESFVYLKELGWHEWDYDGDAFPAYVGVLPTMIGYNIMRLGCDVEHLGWSMSKEEAIEFAVDRSRDEVNAHELRQSERD